MNVILELNVPDVIRSLSNNNQDEKRNVTYNIITNDVTAPVKVGDEVGKLNVYEDGNFKYYIPLTVLNEVPKANIFTIFLRNSIFLSSGLITLSQSHWSTNKEWMLSILSSRRTAFISV